MTENRPAAEAHPATPIRDGDFYARRALARVAAASVEQPKPAEIKAPRIRHYTFGTTRPLAPPLPAEPLRLTRSEIEAALVGSFTYTPHKEQIIDRILLQTARMDQCLPGSDAQRAHQQTIMRELRMLGLYPV
jgi:hypothetical protein